MDVTIGFDSDGLPGVSEGCSEFMATGFGSLHVSMAGEARTNGDDRGGAELRCDHCGEPLDEDGVAMDGFDGNGGCLSRVATPCSSCNEDGVVGGVECTDCGGIGERPAPHVPVVEPGSFANSAGVTVCDSDSVTVSLSVGDPRGAFTLTVSRRDGILYLDVPHPSNPMPHEPLTEIRTGYYRIGQ